jgi:hypothetical protein
MWPGRLGQRFCFRRRNGRRHIYSSLLKHNGYDTSQAWESQHPVPIVLRSGVERSDENLVCETNLTPHTSHLTPHTSHLKPHTSHIIPIWCHVLSQTRQQDVHRRTAAAVKWMNSTHVLTRVTHLRQGTREFCIRTAMLRWRFRLFWNLCKEHEATWTSSSC